MFSVDSSYNIEVSNGDTFNLQFELSENGAAKTISDVAVFTLKRKITENAILRKEVQFNGSSVSFQFTKADFLTISPGTFCYDIYLKNLQYTLFAPKSFIVLGVAHD